MKYNQRLKLKKLYKNALKKANKNIECKKSKQDLFWLDGYENGIQIEWYKEYQNNARIYLDEYQSDEPEIETDNFFYERFLRRK